MVSVDFVFIRAHRCFQASLEPWMPCLARLVGTSWAAIAGLSPTLRPGRRVLRHLNDGPVTRQVSYSWRRRPVPQATAEPMAAMLPVLSASSAQTFCEQSVGMLPDSLQFPTSCDVGFSDWPSPLALALIRRPHALTSCSWVLACPVWCTLVRAPTLNYCDTGRLAASVGSELLPVLVL